MYHQYLVNYLRRLLYITTIMSWETDGPCRHKRQRPSRDSEQFWVDCEQSDWVINGATPSFISASNERRASMNGSGYNLRSAVGRTSVRFTQSEDCGYESNFQDQLQDEEDSGIAHVANTDVNVDTNENAGEDDGDEDDDDDDYDDENYTGTADSVSVCSSYQDESEESSCNEYHPNERDDEENEMEEEEALLDLDFDDIIELDADLDLDCEIELLLCDSPTARVIGDGSSETV
jgi:hypothetical protein